MKFFLHSLVRKCSHELITVNFNTGGVVRGKCVWSHGATVPSNHPVSIANLQEIKQWKNFQSMRNVLTSWTN